MIYLKKFNLLTDIMEYDILAFVDNKTIYTNQWPMKLFPIRELEEIRFSDITIFYGGNGSGKSTLLNIISEKLGSNRINDFQRGSYFDLYVKECHYEMNEGAEEIKTITSDDVFDYLINIRAINSNVNRVKEKLGEEYMRYKMEESSSFQVYEKLKDSYDAKKKTVSQYIRSRLTNNIEEKSNGESALIYWEREIKENAIYILDEPENSLSAENILKLKTFIEESVRFYNCQFIISTHSPFLLSLLEAKIYDLESFPVKEKKWTELKNVRIYYEFFKERAGEFEK